MKKILPFLVFMVFFTSCKEPLLPIPSTNLDSTGDSNISLGEGFVSPSNFSASQGLYRKIILSWNGVNKASRYEIFSAKTPYDTFEKIKEVPASKLSCEIAVKSNADNYYKIRAVNSSEKATAFSSIIRGTSLAQPVISDITTTSDNSSDVYWYMSNSDAYKDEVCYTIICFDESGAEVARQSTSRNLDELKVTFENLKPNTNYLYQVESFLISNQDAIEKSDIVDALTARRTRPDAPENLTASQGIFKDKIELSFTLPNFVDVALGNKVYSQNPLYFKIYRRVKVSDSEETVPYELICSYFGYNATKTDGVSFTEEGLESDYVPGETVVFVDTHVERGVVYEYKVQSFADNTTREISSDTLCIAETVGHTLAVASLKQNTYEQVLNEEGTAYCQIKVNFSFAFETFQKDEEYQFLLEEYRYLLESDNSDVEDTEGELVASYSFATKNEVNSFVRTFDLTTPETIRGYYKYILYILPKEISDTTSAFDTINFFGKVLVTESTSKPEILGFAIKDGFTDKFVVEWMYDATCNYKLSYVPYVNGEPGEVVVIEQMPEEILSSTTGDTVQYVDIALSGDVREYSLQATRGISVYSEPVLVKTLGTPTLVDAGSSYTNLSVKWKPVQKATSYNLAFSYDLQDSLPVEELKGQLQYSLATEELSTDEEGYYVYTLEAPPGYDNAQMAGWPIILTMEAISSENEEILGKTESSISQCLIGPALTNVVATKAASSEKITIQWNKVSGAKKYLVKRDRYEVDNTTLANTDFYSVSTDGKTVSVLGVDENVSNSISVAYDAETNLFTLEDIYTKDDSSGIKWKDSQDKINWGFPYHYVVFPLENEMDEFDTETATLGSKITYNALDKVEGVGSALGYGHNVCATKSEHSKNVVITWDEPYLNNLKSYDVSLWRSVSGENSWEKTSFGLDESGTKFVITPKGKERIIPYDYAIRYDAKNTVPSATYLAYLESQKDEYNEPINKGYPFALEIEASNVATSEGVASFTERIRWTLWDFEERARGPKEGFVIALKNNNLGSDWKTVASVDLEGNVSINNDSSYNTIIEQQGNGITLTPTDTSATHIHEGLLKVLRDYKHYVQVVSERENSEGEVIAASFADNEDSVYSYRQVTDAELAKATMLVVAYAFYRNDEGSPDYSNIGEQFKYGGGGTVQGKTGSATFTDREGYGITDITNWGKYYMTYSFSNYCPEMKDVSGNSSSFLKISSPSSYTGKIKGNADNYIYSFLDTNQISVAYDDDSLGLTGGTVTFT
ncbi:MAG: hypothetical protein E7062_08695, partial [Spirochaetaceae bacterium]|nr:hypothetical protein [Spirochaetaceae bacterium]